jgi:hypothetical protein
MSYAIIKTSIKRCQIRKSMAEFAKYRRGRASERRSASEHIIVIMFTF